MQTAHSTIKTIENRVQTETLFKGFFDESGGLHKKGKKPKTKVKK